MPGSSDPPAPNASADTTKTKGASRARTPSKTAGTTKAASKGGAQAKTGVKGGIKAKAGVKTKPAASRVAPGSKKKGGQVVLLSGGNPQIAKGDGDAPVQAYIAAMPGWKRETGERLDALIVRTVPAVQKTVKWNSPFYGVEGQGWFLGLHCFAKFVRVTFFRGTSLRPVPAGPSKVKDTRYADIHEGELDEAQMSSWVKQAAALPGEHL